MSALDELIDKWVHKDHPEQMPPIEVCLYECSLIDGLDWAAKEGATELAQLRLTLAERDKTIAEMRKVMQDYIDGEYSTGRIRCVVNACLSAHPAPESEKK